MGASMLKPRSGGTHSQNAFNFGLWWRVVFGIHSSVQGFSWLPCLAENLRVSRIACAYSSWLPCPAEEDWEHVRHVILTSTSTDLMRLALWHIVGRLGMFADKCIAKGRGEKKKGKKKKKFVCGQPENLGKRRVRKRRKNYRLQTT